MATHNRSAPAWWWLPLLSMHQNKFLTWRDGEWWWQAWWLFVAGPVFRALMWCGVWEVREGRLYTQGRLCSPRVNAYASALRSRTRFLSYVRRGH